MPLPNTARLNEVIDLLNETQGINQKTELASVIGAPTVATDNISEQINDLALVKNNLVVNLNQKEQTSSINEPMLDLVNKVGNIQTGIPFAMGSGQTHPSTRAFGVKDGTGDATINFLEVVNNLDFDPQFMILKVQSGAYGGFYCYYNRASAQATTFRGLGREHTTTVIDFNVFGSDYSSTSNVLYCYRGGFRLPILSSSALCTWYAFG